MTAVDEGETGTVVRAKAYLDAARGSVIPVDRGVLIADLASANALIAMAETLGRIEALLQPIRTVDDDEPIDAVDSDPYRNEGVGEAVLGGRRWFLLPATEVRETPDLSSLVDRLREVLVGRKVLVGRPDDNLPAFDALTRDLVLAVGRWIDEQQGS